MAEFVMKDLVKKAGLEDRFQIASAATSAEEIGEPVYPPARRKLAEHGIGCAGKTARRLESEDLDRYDLLIGMDGANLRDMRRICGGDRDGKIHLLMEFTDRPGDVAHLAGCAGRMPGTAASGERGTHLTPGRRGWSGGVPPKGRMPRDLLRRPPGGGTDSGPQPPAGPGRGLPPRAGIRRGREIE